MAVEIKTPTALHQAEDRSQWRSCSNFVKAKILINEGVEKEQEDTYLIQLLNIIMYLEV